MVNQYKGDGNQGHQYQKCYVVEKAIKHIDEVTGVARDTFHKCN